jgi:hypothetical protein
MVADYFIEIAKLVSKKINDDVNAGKNLNMLLAAYNEWQEYEKDGANYIFDINNNKDLKFVVDRGFLSAQGIAFVVNKCETGLFQFSGNDPDAGVKGIDTEDLKKILINTSDTFIRYVLMYAPRCGSNSAYTSVYEEYIVPLLESGVFNPSY